MNERLMRIEEVAKFLSINPRTVRRLWQRGEFPQPIRLGASVRWREQTLVDFVNNKSEQAQRETALHR